MPICNCHWLRSPESERRVVRAPAFRWSQSSQRPAAIHVRGKACWVVGIARGERLERRQRKALANRSMKCWKRSSCYDLVRCLESWNSMIGLGGSFLGLSKCSQLKIHLENSLCDSMAFRFITRAIFIRPDFKCSSIQLCFDFVSPKCPPLASPIRLPRRIRLLRPSAPLRSKKRVSP